MQLVATVLKLGDRTQVGAVHLSTSLVAVLQLTAAALVWFFVAYRGGQAIDPAGMAAIVSLSAGALFANVVSVAMMMAETVMLRR